MARLLLRDLTPGTNYKIQLRAVEGDSVSEWSRLFSLPVTADSVAPETPTLTSWVVSGDSFVAAWEPLNSTLDRNKDLDRYEIQLSNGSKTVIVPVRDTTYTLSFERNRALFTTPAPTVTARLRAADAIGNASAWTSTLSATNPPPSPVTDLVALAQQDAIGLTWTAPSDVDLVGYNVYTTNDVKVGSTTATSFTYLTTTYTSQALRVAAVDKFGQESTRVTSNAVTPLSPFAVDATPPNTPGSLAATIVNNSNGVGARADLTWTLSPVPDDLSEFVVRYRKVGETFYRNQTFTADNNGTAGSYSGSIELQSAYTNYEFQIQASDWQANESAWSATVTAVSPSAGTPAKTTGVVSTAGRDNLRYSWTAATEANVREYETTFSTSSTFASGNITFKTTTPYLVVSGLTPATTYYARVRAINVFGTAGTFSDTHTQATLGQLTPGDIGAPTLDQFGNLQAKVDDSIKSYVEEYYLSTSETTQTGGTWSTTPPTRTPDTYIWTRTTVTYQDNTSSTTPPVLVTGNTGADGTSGKGITSVTPYYARVTAGNTPTQPPSGTATPAAPWQTTEPDYAAGTELYRTEKILYTDNTIQYTTQVKVSAYTAAATAMTTANGKNKMIFSTSDASGTVDGNGNSYSTGDTWFKRDANGVIIAQWEYVTGGSPAWQSRSVGSDVIANLNVGKLVSGDIATALIKITNSGSIQSSDYVANSLGWRIGPTGLEVNKGSVRASALIGDTLGSSTGTINIAAGANIQLNGGYIKSNTNTGTTMATAETSGAGFYLGNDGLFIGTGGKVKANALISDTLTSTIITLGTGGEIKGGSWALNSSGLTIPDGAISAGKLSIQQGQNIAPYMNSTFPGNPAAYPYAQDSIVTSSVVASDGTIYPYIAPQMLKVNWTALAVARAYHLSGSGTGQANSDWSSDVEPGGTYIVSAWIYSASACVANELNINAYGVTTTTNTLNTTQFGARGQLKRVSDDVSALAAGTWTRMYTTITIGASTSRIVLSPTNYQTGTAKTIYYSGIQLEKKLAASDLPSQFSPPGITSVNGAVIRTGEIRSTNNTTVNGVSEPVWSIPMNGAATFSGMRVLGNTVLGNSTTDPTSMLSSSNYVAGSSGWRITANGAAEFNNVTVRGAVYATTGTFSGTINASGGTFSGNITSSATITGGVLQTEPSGRRIVMTSNNLNALSWYNQYGEFSTYLSEGTASTPANGGGTTYSNSISFLVYRPTFGDRAELFLRSMTKDGVTRSSQFEVTATESIFSGSILAGTTLTVGSVFSGITIGSVLDMNSRNIIEAGSITASGNIQSSTALVSLDAIRMDGPTLGSYTANLNWNSSNGFLRVNTSSRRYKENIKNAEIDIDRVLSLVPRTFQRNDEYTDDKEPKFVGYRPDNPWYVGFIAEEAHELGITDWVEYGPDGQPQGFAYANWSVAHQAVLRKHNEEIKELKSKNEFAMQKVYTLEQNNKSVEERLARLEAAVESMQA